MKHIITIQRTQSEQHVNKMIGSWSEWDLTETGVLQAHRIGKRLSEEIGEKEYILYASDLLRARHTAEIVGTYLHTKPFFTDALREFHLGEAIGTRHHRCTRRHIELVICDVARNGCFHA